MRRTNKSYKLDEITMDDSYRDCTKEMVVTIDGDDAKGFRRCYFCCEN